MWAFEEESTEDYDLEKLIVMDQVMELIRAQEVEPEMRAKPYLRYVIE